MASFGFARSSTTGDPPARMSTAGAAATWRTVSRPCPGAVCDVSLVKSVSVFSPRLCQVRDGRVVLPCGERDVAGPSDRRTGVGGIRRRQGDLVVAGGELERAGEISGLEVVEREVAVDVDVDGRVGDAMQHRELGGLRRCSPKRAWRDPSAAMMPTARPAAAVLRTVFLLLGGQPFAALPQCFPRSGGLWMHPAGYSPVASAGYRTSPALSTRLAAAGPPTSVAERVREEMT